MTDRPELDRWILSKYNKLVKEVTEEMNRYDHMKSVRKIQEFVTEDLSNWYIRRARRRFWQEELNQDKKSVYLTTYEVLVGVSKLIAPFAPFLADEVFTKLTGEESVHIAFYPKAEEHLIDANVESRMDLVRDLVGLGRGTREKEKIKVRQPLTRILVDGKYEELISDLTPLIMDELNVKEVVFEKQLDQYMNFSLKPNFKVAGPVFGGKIKDFGAALAAADGAEAAVKLEAGEEILLNVGGEETRVNKDLVEVKITAKEGFTVAMENNLFTILDTTVTTELIQEGLARELVSKVQQLRKQHDFEMMDHIRIQVQADPEVQEAIEKHIQYIRTETLAEELNYCGEDLEKYDLNGHSTGIHVEKLA